MSDLIQENAVITNLKMTDPYSMGKRSEASKAKTATYGDIQQTKTTKRNLLKL